MSELASFDSNYHHHGRWIGTMDSIRYANSKLKNDTKEGVSVCKDSEEVDTDKVPSM